MPQESSPSLSCSRSRPRAATMQPNAPLGPLRHPKPLTPSDFHSMLEKEQEAMVCNESSWDTMTLVKLMQCRLQVNRLSRELSSLRQQTASVASTASSTSTTLNDSADLLHSPPYLHNSTPLGRHRSSSSLSSSYIPAVQESRAGITTTRDTGLPFPRPTRSRQQSVNSVQHSGMTSPSLPSSLHQQGDHFPHRISLSQSQQGASPTNATFRLEETAHSRAEFESTKQENEALRRRVRELELALRKSQGGESTSTGPTVSALTNELKKASVGETE